MTQFLTWQLGGIAQKGAGSLSRPPHDKDLNILLPPLREISGIGDIRKIHAGDVGHGDPRGNGRRVHPLSARHGGSLCRGPIIAKFCQHNQHSSFLSQSYCDVKLLDTIGMYMDVLQPLSFQLSVTPSSEYIWDRMSLFAYYSIWFCMVCHHLCQSFFSCALGFSFDRCFDSISNFFNVFKLWTA